jgi:hypothetical protein
VSDKTTKVDKFILWCKNHKFISILVIVGLVIIYLGNITGAVEKLCGLFRSNSPPISASNTNAPSKTEVKWLPPELPDGCNEIYLSLGNGIESYERVDWLRNPTNRPSFFTWNGITPFDGYVKNNRFYVDFDIPVHEPNTSKVIKIRNMKIDPTQIPPEWDVNYSSNALEIVNEDNVPLCQVYYKNPFEVNINGIFIFNGSCIAFGKNGMRGFGFNENPASLDLKPLFKYPANLHRGEFAN